MAATIIETIGLSKNYKLKGKKTEVNALNNINISIKEGEIFGLLGPNGAGKTTLIKILTTLIQPTSGDAIIDGFNVVQNPKKVKPLIGLMLGNEMLYYRITGYDNLKFFCKIYKVPNYKGKIYDIVKEFGLEKWLNQYVGSYSNGMKLKLALCRTLLLDRKILILDEPTLGLDVKSIIDIIKKLKSINKTIFLTSHDMNVVEKLADRIAFINKGNILKIGDKESVKDLSQKEIKIKVEINNNKDNLRTELLSQKFIKDVNNESGGLIISMNNRSNYSDLFQILSKYEIRKIKEIDVSLEELFLKYV